ncbi:MAG: ADP-ribose pyrophosphatase [Pseudomonadota bacterium]|jgi:ADP-ribose pyrophosphatase
MASERRLLWQESRYRIDVHRVPTRSGVPIERAFIDHPGAVVVWAEDADGRVAMIRNQRHAIGARLRELPAGTLRPGEDPSLAAARELEEETGLCAARVEPLGAFYLAPGSSNERMFAFLARELRAGAQQLDDDEDIEVVWVARDVLDADVAAGRIDAASTLACWALRRARADDPGR